MTMRVRLRSESLPAVIPEITLTTTSSGFRGGRRDSHEIGHAKSHQTLCKIEDHLPSIQIKDYIVKRNNDIIRDRKRDKKVYLEAMPLLNSLSRSEEHLPSIPDSATLVRRHSTPKNILLVSKATRSNGLPASHLGKKRRKVRRVEIPSPKQQRESEEGGEENVTSIIHKEYLLPPLPTGSLTFQRALKDLHVSDSNTSSDDSGSEAFDGFSTNRKKRKSRPKLAWYGPIVEYKGHHIYLSTLNNLKANAGRYVARPWYQ